MLLSRCRAAILCAGGRPLFVCCFLARCQGPSTSGGSPSHSLRQPLRSLPVPYPLAVLAQMWRPGADVASACVRCGERHTPKSVDPPEKAFACRDGAAQRLRRSSSTWLAVHCTALSALQSRRRPRDRRSHSGTRGPAGAERAVDREQTDEIRCGVGPGVNRRPLCGNPDIRRVQGGPVPARVWRSVKRMLWLGGRGNRRRRSKRLQLYDFLPQLPKRRNLDCPPHSGASPDPRTRTQDDSPLSEPFHCDATRPQPRQIDIRLRQDYDGTLFSQLCCFVPPKILRSASGRVC